MATPTNYTYSIQTSFPNHKVACDRLLQEVRASAIITAVDYINSSADDDTCDVWFKDVLSDADKAVLDAIVAAHSGEPLPDDKTTKVVFDKTTAGGVSLFALDAPSEADKKPVMVNSPATEGTFTWLTSRGDDLSPSSGSGRGTGPQAFLSFDEPGTKEVEIQFIEPVELHDGHVSWRPTSDWGFEDSWSLSVRLPATTVTPNAENKGNCNKVDTGQGFSVIVPANGDGAYDVDLTKAVPIPD